MKSNKLAGGGICAALCLVLLFIGSYLPAKIAFLFASSVVMGICILRYRGLAAFTTYFAVFMISVFAVPNKLLAWSYASVFGIYPLLKLYIERINKIVWEYIVKFFVWNIHLFGMYIILSAFGQTAFLTLAQCGYGCVVLCLCLPMIWCMAYSSMHFIKHIINI